MAGLWIPWECGLERKTEILRIAKEMQVDSYVAATQCMIVWCWAQDQTVDGIIPGITASDVSIAVGIKGIGEAMRSVGWIFSDNDTNNPFISFPNWDRFNSEPAKKRAINAQRMRIERAEARLKFLEEKELELQKKALKKRAKSVH